MGLSLRELGRIGRGLAQNLQPVPYFVKKQFELFVSRLLDAKEDLSEDMIQVRATLGSSFCFTFS